jgi:hypothetical protein
MKPTTFSVTPNFKEDDEEQPFYQTPIFKLAIGLAVVALLLLLSVVVCMGLLSDKTEVIIVGGVENPENNSEPQGENVVPNVQELDVVGASEPFIMTPVPVPAFLQGTKLEPLYVSLCSVWNRHRMVIIITTVVLVVLVAAGIAYAVHLENERVARELELELELERQRELERQQQELFASQLQNLQNVVTNEGLNWKAIIGALPSAYFASFMFTAVLLATEFYGLWDFDGLRKKRLITYFILFLSLHAIVCGFCAILAVLLCGIGHLVRNVGSSPFIRLVLAAVVAVMHVIVAILSIPMIFMAAFLYLSGIFVGVKEVYVFIWVDSMREYSTLLA